MTLPRPALLLAVVLATPRLSACSGQKDTGQPVAGDSGNPTVDSTDNTDSSETGDSSSICSDTGYSLSITSPVDNATYIVGDTVTLSASIASTSSSDTWSWTVDGTAVGTTNPATWTATAGAHTLAVAWHSDCNDANAEVTINVVASPVTVYGPELGVSGLAVKGMSAAPDSTLWVATTSGLLHLDPVADTLRTYTTADGLYKTGPYSVLAHSDGTLWVGDIGDLTREGSHFSINADGSLTLIEALAFPSNGEIQYVLRLREQPYGIGAGDVWMGTNEGICVWQQDGGIFAQHAHPTHPHSLTYGLAFSPDASIWNGDQYQLSRWQYEDDGSLSYLPQSEGGDLAEYWIPWPVDVGVEVGITDQDSDGWTLWVASYLYGVARVDVGTDIGTSTTTLMGDPFPSAVYALRADGDGHVWIGTETSLLVWDETTETMTDVSSYLPDPNVQQLTVDASTSPPTVWAGTPSGFVRFIGVP